MNGQQQGTPSDAFDPYLKWLGISPTDYTGKPNHYQLLGISAALTDADAIASVADRQMAHVRTFQSGRYSKYSQQLLSELAKARLCLLDPALRAAYDASLSSAELPEEESFTEINTDATDHPRTPRRGLSSRMSGGGIDPIAFGDEQESVPAESHFDAAPGFPDVESKTVARAQPKIRRTKPSRIKPIWLIAGGGVLLIIVAAALLYFSSKPPGPLPPRESIATAAVLSGNGAQNTPAGNVTPPVTPAPVGANPSTDKPAKNPAGNGATIGAVQPSISAVARPERPVIDDPDANPFRDVPAVPVNVRPEPHTPAPPDRVIPPEQKEDESPPDAAAVTAQLEKISAQLDQIPAEVLPEAVEQLLALLDDAQEVGDFDLAVEVGRVATLAARKSHDKDLAAQVYAQIKLLRDQEEYYRAADTARKTLEKTPGDADANLNLGRFVAMVQGKWDLGLPLLIEGSDPQLSALAKRDQAVPDKAVEQVAVADGWWKVGSTTAGAALPEIKRRAVYWYDQATPELPPSEKKRVTARVDSFKSAGASSTGGRRGAVRTNTIGMKLVLVPAGDFLMGSPENERERKSEEVQHRVKISKPFYIGMYEVTQSEYARVMGKNPSHHVVGRGKSVDDDTSRYPVERVSWQDAMAFCHRLGLKEKRKYRLPTEAEWEYACRGGATSAFGFGDAASSAQANFNGHVPYGGAAAMQVLGRPTFVGKYAPNRWGLYDMHGNAFEWCIDGYQPDYYARSTTVDPTASSSADGDHVVRGGCWGDPGDRCRSASRSQRNGMERFDHVGFRVVCEK